ncbi:MAG: 3-hydroxyacyl-CoA dehydrogenase family protein [Acidimicrobiales bacterium]
MTGVTGNSEPPPMPAGRVPAAVGVLGGGRMGAGIAHAFLCAGSGVSLAEATEPASQAAQRRVTEALQASHARGKLSTSPEEALSRLSLGVGPQHVAGCQLVVEAVPEDPALKASLLAAVERVVDERATIATNTSSLSIDELSAVLARPHRFLGLHFFNPVPASELVEVVVGSATSAELVQDARAWVAALGKTPVVVRDSPGFASSRLGLTLGLEAIRMVSEGVASVEDIDSAMVLGYKHPIGPLRLTDLVGLDVRLAIAEYLAARLGERFEPPDLLRQKVAAGELGRKSGQGFYSW